MMIEQVARDLRLLFDLWVDWWRARHARGDVIIVRFADDSSPGSSIRMSARFLADLRERFAKFGLELHPDKTRLIEFGRYAAQRAAGAGLGKPETFDFLGFTHICATSRSGRFWCGASRSRNGCGPSCARSRPAQATPASTHPGARAVAGKRGARTPRLLRRARQQRRGGGLPRPGRCGTGSGRCGAAASAPASTGSGWTASRPMAPTRPHPCTPSPSVRFDARTRGRSPVR